MSDLNESKNISEAFAKQILTSVYSFDKSIGRLDIICSALPDNEMKKKFITELSELMRISLTELLVPVYRERPSLGRASAPGPWFKAE